MTIEEVLEDYRDLERDDLLAALNDAIHRRYLPDQNRTIDAEICRVADAEDSAIGLTPTTRASPGSVGLSPLPVAGDPM
jgi:hypothetical protein